MSQLSFFATDCQIANIQGKALLRFQTLLPTRENPNLPISQDNMAISVDNDVAIVLDKEKALEIARLIHEYII